MAKKQEAKEETLLKMGREEFKEQLEKQIKIGNELLDRHVEVYPTIVYTRFDKDIPVDEKGLDALRSDYSLWNDYNEQLLIAAFTNNGGEYLEKYKNSGLYLLYSTKNKVEQLKDFIKVSINELQSLTNRLNLIPLHTSVSQPVIIQNQAKMDKVFVVYGHDEMMKLKVEHFLREELKLEVVALDEKPNNGMTIIEKFETYSKDCTFAVILMSPDDETEVNGQIFKRARQNVVLELGYFMAKLGRNKVCVLIRGNIEKPSDISGILNISYDSDWKFPLLKEMKSAGVNV